MGPEKVLEGSTARRWALSLLLAFSRRFPEVNRIGDSGATFVALCSPALALGVQGGQPAGWPGAPSFVGSHVSPAHCENRSVLGHTVARCLNQNNGELFYFNTFYSCGFVRLHDRSLSQREKASFPVAILLVTGLYPSARLRYQYVLIMCFL